MTHDFLEDGFIEKYSPIILEQYLPKTKCFGYYVNDLLVGFVGISNDEIEMLFIEPSSFRTGVGTKLIMAKAIAVGATKGLVVAKVVGGSTVLATVGTATTGLTTAGATIIASGIGATSGGSALATTGSMAAVTSAGGVAGMVAGIESFATMVGLFFSMTPTP